MKVGLCLLWIGVALAVGGAGPVRASQASPAATPGGDAQLPQTIWHLVEATLASGSPEAPDDPSRYTIQFLPDGRLAARADCNQVGGTYEVDGQGLTLSGLMSTLVGCPDDSLGDEYTAWLGEVSGFELTDDELILQLTDGGRLRFVPALDGVVWEWQRLEEGNDTVTTPDRPAAYTVAFEPAGRVSVRADCNTGGGRYTIDDSTIAIKRVALTRMVCGNDSLGDAFVQRLEEVTSFTFSEGRLVLVLPMDAGVLLFTARASGEPAATPAAATPVVESR